MISPRLLLTVTQGRSGTKFVSRVLAFFPDVASFHEPAPNFAGDLSAFQRDPSFAVNFLKNEKIPAMQHFADFPVYAETSHLWCQGPLQAWLAAEMKPFPDVIILDRPLRAISLSLLQLGTIPGRTQSGRDWYLDPFQKGNLLHWPDKERFTDYQCCFAYCLEIEERKKNIADAVRKAGTKLTRTSAKELSTWRGLLRFSREIGLPFPPIKSLYGYAFLKRQKINQQSSGKSPLRMNTDALDREEQEVLCATNRCC